MNEMNEVSKINGPKELEYVWVNVLSDYGAAIGECLLYCSTMDVSKGISAKINEILQLSNDPNAKIVFSDVEALLCDIKDPKLSYMVRNLRKNIEANFYFSFLLEKSKTKESMLEVMKQIDEYLSVHRKITLTPHTLTLLLVDGVSTLSEGEALIEKYNVTVNQDVLHSLVTLIANSKDGTGKDAESLINKYNVIPSKETAALLKTIPTDGITKSVGAMFKQYSGM